MKLKTFFTTYEKGKLFSFSFKQFVSFLIKLFAIWGILIVIVFIVEPYYFQQIKFRTYANIKYINYDIEDGFLDIEGRVPSSEPIFSGNETIDIENQTSKPLKISNDMLYKIENLTGNTNISFVGYNPDFYSIFSPSPYAGLDTIRLTSSDCVYIGNFYFFMRKTINQQQNSGDYLKNTCIFIPTSWLYSYQQGYPESLLTFSSWEGSKIKITELKNYTDE